MKKTCYLVGLWFVAGLLPLHAQWYTQLPKVFKRPTATTQAASLAAQRRAAHTARAIQHSRQIHVASQATFRLVRHYSPSYGSLDDGPSTAFAFEEYTQGFRRVWGVTVAHYRIYAPAIEKDGFFKAQPISVSIAGNQHYNDLLLFPLPPQTQAAILPLPLAKHSAKEGELVNSYGIYNGKFNFVHGRMVKKVTPGRLITSFEFNPEISRMGACGGPVLNEQNEVVGVHSGSIHEKESFVVPVEFLYRLLAEYDHPGQGQQTLLFQGHPLYSLGVNEAMREIITLHGEHVVNYHVVEPLSSDIDLAHLENLIELDPSVTAVQLTIERTLLHPQYDQPFKRQFLYITYDLRTGKITQTEKK